ncbi:MAG: DUF2845 domain-containing protein [Candidatus Competibacter sp.]|nr:DUF2845 domain-containing protein [Candidatus Competibacter sp.]
MSWREVLAVVALLATAGASAASAFADSLRCGRYVVQTGYSQAQVLDLCGQPRYAWQDGFIEQAIRRSDGYYPGYPTPQPYPLPPGYETEFRRVIPVSKWQYHFGRGTLLKTLVFHGDTLMEIVDGPRQ